jgi:hypothetical protein
MMVSMETTHEFICYYDQKLILIPKFIDVKKVYFLFLGILFIKKIILMINTHLQFSTISSFKNKILTSSTEYVYY